MALSRQDARMAFECEQFDQFASLTRYYVLMFFYEDGSVEMLERSNGRLYLKRTKVSIPRSAFFLGANVNIFGKPTKLTNYADEVTRQLCQEISEVTAVLIAEEAFASIGRYIAILSEECGYSVSNVQMVWVKQKHAEDYAIPEALIGKRCVVVQCVREGALGKGEDAMRRCPGMLSAADPEQAKLWAQLATDTMVKPLVVLGEQNSSVVVLKPHLLAANCAGAALQQLLNTGLEPTGLTQLTLSSSTIDQFLVPYRGVLPDVPGTAKSFAGNVWVVQLVCLDDSKDVVSTVRQECGPFDTVIAKKVFPKSIRARFGVDQCCNAVHCCDLPGEGPLYADFFFSGTNPLKGSK